MLQAVVVIFAVIASVAAQPGLIGAPLANTAPASFVTATSSQVIARNYNGIATGQLVTPVAKTTAKYITPSVYTSPLAYPTSLNYASHPAPFLF